MVEFKFSDLTRLDKIEDVTTGKRRLILKPRGWECELVTY